MDFSKVREMVDRFFNGQYEVKKFLGEGSFSEVYLVKHRFLDDFRAMKIIKEPIKTTTKTNELFREVQIATQLRHENIISIYDAGIISDDDNFAYFVMEYVPGGDLRDYLASFVKSDISMPVNRVLDMMKQILLGLNVLHSSNPPIVHRDLKLNNILLNYNALGDIVIKISDFGFSKEVTTNLCDADIVGTRPYMAPECFSKRYSAMTDIYAVGVIFYQLLTAHYPYGTDQFDIVDLDALKPWEIPLKKPSHYNRNVSERLDEIVVKCLEKDYKNRYMNAAELLDDVEMLIGESKSSTEFMKFENEYDDDYSDYPINNSLKDAFQLAKAENRLDEAIEILEKEVLSDYDIRRYYGETLRMWKSKRPDIKLISKAFTVNLKAKNYYLSCDLLKEAIAYNPSLKNKYEGYIDLYGIFIGLTKDHNLIRAVISLEELMQSNNEVRNIYANTIDVLKTFDIEQVVAESIRLVKMNRLIDAANLMEFAVLCDSRLRQKYEYKLSLWKQNLEVYYKKNVGSAGETVDYAIDLGTVDSIISYYNDGQPIIIKNHITGDEITPSAVLVMDDEVYVGERAKEAIIEKNSNVISEFKENMGFPITFSVENSTKTFLPEELSSEVLKDSRVSVFNQCGVDMEHAVVCIPANSNPLKTKAIMDACEMAGFKSYNLIFEPIAAAIAYDSSESQESNALWIVYDLGGSTFKASLIKDNGKIIEQAATVGFDNFGGNSLDWRLVDEVFAPKIADDLGLVDFNRANPKYDRIFSKLKRASEAAKINLSDFEESEINIPDLFINYDFIHLLSKEEFKEAIEPVVRSTFDLVYALIDQNGHDLSDIDKVILAGGSCLSPAVIELIEDEFKLPIDNCIDPLTVVAKGAAIYAGGLKKPDDDYSLDSVSLILNRNNNEIVGKLFSCDNKCSFLGCNVEFIHQKKNHSTGKIPVDIDGRFKIDLDEGNWKINVYKGDELVEIDEKSPNEVSDSIYIPFFEGHFSFSEDALKGYDELMVMIDYLNQYAKFNEWDILDYVERLVGMGEIALNQTNIYMNYLTGIAQSMKKDLEFSILLSNVKNKIRILDEDVDLGKIEEDGNLNQLKKIHENLIEKYVIHNKDKVIEECFFNLKNYGAYDDEALSGDLIEKAVHALNNSNHDELFRIVEQLYEIDGRKGYGR